MTKRTRRGRISLRLTSALACLAAIMLASCKPQVPSSYIQPDDLADILYDYYMCNSLAEQSDDPDYNHRVYYLAVLKKHDVSEAEFDSSLVYYYTHAERLAKIYETVANRMKSEATKLGASVGEMSKYANLTSQGDTANIWNESTCAMLMPAPPYNRLDFSLKADTTFKRGDSFVLNIMANFMYQSGTKDGIIYAKVSYTGDSTAVFYANVNSSGLSRLQIPANNEADIKSIDGFFYLGQGSDDSFTRKILFIDDIQLIRFHRKKDDVPATAETTPPANDTLADKDKAMGRTDTLKPMTPKPLKLKREAVKP
jgi:hypothetical protein